MSRHKESQPSKTKKVQRKTIVIVIVAVVVVGLVAAAWYYWSMSNDNDDSKLTPKEQTVSDLRNASSIGSLDDTDKLLIKALDKASNDAEKADILRDTAAGLLSQDKASQEMKEKAYDYAKRAYDLKPDLATATLLSEAAKAVGDDTAAEKYSKEANQLLQEALEEQNAERQ